MNWDDTTDETAAERLVGSVADREDRAVEAALRPKDLGEFIGQEKVREQLDLVLRAARARGATADHVLLSGAPGLGKTTLSMIIAAEMEAPIRITSGPAIQHAGDLAAILSSLEEGEVLFLDEIHRMSRPAEEMLYMAMEDFRVDVIVGKGPGATAIPLELPPFTLVGATTRAGLLPPPLRDRFGFTAHMEFYEPTELERVIHRSANLLDVEIDPAGAAEIAGRSRGTPASPTGCCAASGTTRRSRPTGSSPKTSPGPRSRSTRSTDAASTGSTAVSSKPCSSCSAADRWACPRSPLPWGRSARPSKRSPNPSSYGRDYWPAPRADASPPPPRGRIWASPRPARQPGETDKGTCSGRDDGGTGRVRNPGAMLSVVPSAWTRLDSADAAFVGGADHPHPPGRSPPRSCEGNSVP